jgi:hypothetical protein
LPSPFSPAALPVPGVAGLAPGVVAPLPAGVGVPGAVEPGVLLGLLPNEETDEVEDGASSELLQAAPNAAKTTRV